MTLFLSVAALGKTLPSNQAMLDTKTIYDNSQDKIVQILIKDNTKQDAIMGTGFYVASNILVTNYHVVSSYIEKPQFYRIFAKNSKTHKETPIKLVAFDIAHDLAILQTPESKKEYFKINPKAKLEVGEKVYSMGYPLGISLNLNESTMNENADEIHYFIATQLSHGMSGGPSFNAQGELVGVNDMVMNNTMNSFLVKSIYIKPLLNKRALDLSGSDSSIRQTLLDEQSNQIHDLSVIYFAKIKPTAFTKVHFGKYQVPSQRIDELNDCSMSINVDNIKKQTMSCEDKIYRKIYFSDTENIPTLTYNYAYYRNIDSTPVDFLKSIPLHEYDISGNCVDAGSIKVNAINYNVTMCVSSTNQLDGIYNVFFQAKSLEKDSYFVINLNLYGVSKINSYNVFNQFLKGITWNK